MATKNKEGKFELQFCSICGQSFESEYKLVKHLSVASRSNHCWLLLIT